MSNAALQSADLCTPLDLVCQAGIGLGWLGREAVDAVTASATDSLAHAVGEGVSQMLGSLSTLWMNIPTPAITESGAVAAGGAGEVPGGGVLVGVGSALNYVWWIGLAVAVLALMGLGAHMAIQSRRGEGERHLGRIGIVLIAVLLLGSSAALIGALAPASNAGAGASPTVRFLQGSTWYLMAAIAVGSVLVAAIKMAWEQRAQPGKDLLKSLITLVVVSAVGLNLVMLLLQAGDSFADWIVGRSLGGGTFADGIEQMVSTPEGSVLTAIVVILVGLLLLLTSVFQIMLMVMRGAMLVLLTGILPLAAAATNTEQGKQWFQKSVGWLLAFILYKPAAALVYATAFTLSGQGMTGGADTSGIVELLAGLMLMVMAVLTLPALMRFISPAVGALGNGGGGATGLALAGAAALPTGAAMVARHTAGGAAGSGGSQGSSPSGSAGASGSRGAPGSGGSAGPNGTGGASSSSRPGGGGGSTPTSGGTSAGGAGASGARTGAGASGAGAGGGGGAAAGAGAAAAGPVGVAATGLAKGAQAAGQVVRDTAMEAGETDNGGGPSGSGR